MALALNLAIPVPARHAPSIVPASLTRRRPEDCAAGLRQSDETPMHRGHDLWLATLKWVAEAK
jgi:hypothetical protein